MYIYIYITLYVYVYTYECVYVCIYIYIHTHINNTIGAAAEARNLDRFGKKVCPGTLGEIKAG